MITKWSKEAEYKNLSRLFNRVAPLDAVYTVEDNRFTFIAFDINVDGSKRNIVNYFNMQWVKAYLETKSIKKYVTSKATYYYFDHYSVKAYAASQI